MLICDILRLMSPAQRSCYDGRRWAERNLPVCLCIRVCICCTYIYVYVRLLFFCCLGTLCSSCQAHVYVFGFRVVVWNSMQTRWHVGLRTTLQNSARAMFLQALTAHVSGRFILPRGSKYPMFDVSIYPCSVNSGYIDPWGYTKVLLSPRAESTQISPPLGRTAARSARQRARDRMGASKPPSEPRGSKCPRF